jgi:glutamate/tyrosine decarboxylase-like PLP-dependent enzyme
LPLWFSLATYGTEAYRDAIEHALDVTRQGAQLIDDAEHLELIMDPELSVLLFRRTGWGPADYQAWSDRLLEEGTAFVTPTSWNGEVVLRLCIINPLTSVDDLRIIVDSLA